MSGTQRAYPCIHCSQPTVLTCTHCWRAICSYCADENPTCSVCAGGDQGQTSQDGLTTYVLSFAELVEAGWRYERP
jgi:hypothetical protein